MEVEINELNNTRWYRMLSGIIIALTILFTWKLWGADRLAPTAPLFGIQSYSYGLWGNMLRIGIIISALMFAFGLRLFEWVLLALLALGFADDLNRLRPDFYQYFIIVGFWGMGGTLRNTRLLNALRIMQAGIYIWAGLQKLNPSFWKLAPSFFFNASVFNGMPHTAVHLVMVMPLLEIAIGLCFISGWFLRPAVVAAIVLHILIVIDLALIHWNVSMMLYNVFLAAGNFLLFNKTEYGFFSDKILKGFIPKVAFMLFVFMPMFNLFHVWPHYMSAGMYSFRTRFGCVTVDEDLKKKLPPEALNEITVSPRGQFLVFNTWLYNETGCIPNPQSFVYNKMYLQLKQRYAASDSVRLIVYP
ncbi:MAG TPA: hypothetical protein VG603_13965 [Chitinophagales bacterium]|nr:hypothetical protein [Chitinophagales bacterium]